MARDYDKLNALGTKSIPYDKYFGEMSLTRQQIESRIKLAEDLEDSLLFLFQLINIYKENNIDIPPYIETITKQFQTRYKAQIEKNIQTDKGMNAYVDLMLISLVGVTIKHIKDKYYLSDDRAVYVAENEANTLMNYLEYTQAVASGKTKKKWVDMKDSRERATHLKVGGTVIPIDDVFVVGESLMKYPKDNSLGADLDEIVNCRCSILYF